MKEAPERRRGAARRQSRAGHDRDASVRRGGATASAAWSRWSWPLALAGLFALAWGWRVAYLGRLAHTPLLGALYEDADIYWRWAGALPHLGILGKNAFFLGPLYPYVLALLRLLVGGSIPAVLHVQAVGGALAVVLLADAARRLAGRAAGLLIGLLLAFYEMAVFFDGLVLMESLLFLLESFLLWWVVRGGWETYRARRWLVLGLLVGLLAQGRATALLLLLPALLVLVPLVRGGWRPRLAGAAVLAAGVLVVCLPVTLRTRAVSGEWIPFTYSFGYNLYVGNHPGADGTSRPITGTQETAAAAPTDADGGGELDGREYLRKSEGLVLGPRASSARWAAKATRYVREHPGRALRLALAKAGMAWNRREYAQIENAGVYRLAAGPLGLPLAGQFLGLGTLGLAGLWFAWRRRGPARFVVGYAAVVTLGLVPFFVTDRYRHHLVPAVALLAAFALERLWALARRRPGAGAGRGALLVALLAGLVVVNLPAPGMAGGDFAWRASADLGNKWLAQGRADLALPQLERALALRSAPGRREETSSPATLAELYYDYGRALAAVGRRGESLAWYERALRQAPDDAVVIAALAAEYRAAGRAAEAQLLERRLPTLVGGESHVLESRAWQAAGEGRLDEAERLFQDAVAADPSLVNAWLAVVRLQLQGGRAPEARATLERARGHDVPAPLLHAHEALLAAAAGDRIAAERALALVPPGEPTRDPVLADVLATTRRLLGRGR